MSDHRQGHRVGCTKVARDIFVGVVRVRSGSSHVWVGESLSVCVLKWFHCVL